MARYLHIGLDLGGDTLKVAYAYKYGDKIHYGKLMPEGLPTQVAIPAVAYYKAEEGTWLYGDDVDKSEEGSFVNVVKIKSLLALLAPNPVKSVQESNAHYYHHGEFFPKFYFPQRKKVKENYDEMVKQELTFRAPGYTPRLVCEQFFRHVAAIVMDRVKGLRAFARSTPDGEIRLSVVHPSRMGKAYPAELARLCEVAFGTTPFKMLSSTKALSMYAFQRGLVSNAESILVFDMGEEEISVAKSYLVDGQPVIEGADGHNVPEEIGGTDIDNAIAEYIENGIVARETVGSPSYGIEGHINETGLRSKQYLFLKDIKKAKMILSYPFRGENPFEDGVPVSINMDLYIQRKFTQQQFCDCIGITEGTGIAKGILEYIVSELKRPVNADVKKVFLSGGLTETYGLYDYIKRASARRVKGVEFLTFDDNRVDVDGYTILSHEDSTYAPAVGGAIVGCNNYQIKTVITFSYGTWFWVNDREGKPHKYLSIFADKGTPLKEDENRFYSTGLIGVSSGTIEVDGDELFSANISMQEIRQNKYAAELKNQYIYGRDINRNRDFLCIGDKSEPEFRRRAEQVINLKVVAGGRDGRIWLYHQGARVKIYGGIHYHEGIIVDGEGNARPFVCNDKEQNKGKWVKISYLSGAREGTTTEVQMSSIDVRFSGMSEFVVVAE